MCRRLNSLAKRVSIWLTKQDPTICSIQETLYSERLKIEECVKIFQVNGNNKKSRVFNTDIITYILVEKQKILYLY